MTITINKEKNNTYKVDVIIDKETVSKHLDEALKHEAEHIEIKGFRKGTAPLSMVKDMIDPSKIRSHALNHMLPDLYRRVVNENKLAPIMGPRIELKEFEEGKELSLTLTIVEKPETKIGDYKKALTDLGKTKSKESDAEKREVSNQEVLDTLKTVCEIEIPEIIVQEEVANMISGLISQTQQMGISIEQYAEAHKKTVQQIRDEYKKTAEEIIKADFLISEVAKLEEINISDAQIEDMLKMIPDEESRKQLENPEQKMYIKAVILKNETIQRLAGYAKAEIPEVEKKDDAQHTADVEDKK